MVFDPYKRKLYPVVLCKGAVRASLTFEEGTEKGRRNSSTLTREGQSPIAWRDLTLCSKLLF